MIKKYLQLKKDLKKEKECIGEAILNEILNDEQKRKEFILKNKFALILFLSSSYVTASNYFVSILVININKSIDISDDEKVKFYAKILDYNMNKLSLKKLEEECLIKLSYNNFNYDLIIKELSYEDQSMTFNYTASRLLFEKRDLLIKYINDIVK